MGWVGFNCSIPHKIAVIEHLDGLGDSAKIIGAVNTVVLRGDKYIGENTDGRGFVKDKTPATAEGLAWTERFRVPGEADIVINNTSIGLYPHVDERLDVDADSLRPHMVVADGIPNPPRTLWIRDAEARGCRVMDGLAMLVNQGVIGIEYWTGVDADVTVMRKALEKALSL